MDESGGQLDLSTDAADGREHTDGSEKGRFLGVHFSCCSAYGRLYPNRTNDAYEGRCPRCLSTLSVPIGPGGTSQRFFRAE